ncbi:MULTISPECIES: M20/M25/M40 family metallo-hydrolase [unclassified Vibrio]|uniref:M20/M25/M40 family metallo-hydrolase n=1 Tax=unclassified Vibrio TaxID=2614977 RepID=UPI000C81AFB0|nr:MULTISPECIES: M20/M25/M40 family metallo-hydrolase [unclassified Vibrio]PMI98035.1 peptidase M20 [Vibrio sp. 10N.286.45.E10]PTO99989.1 peptidase M20 [Vibrio sp. 10N.286.45.A3]PTQ22926.1 peptidase M20 [Vibrio sp. 10N.286.46.E10]TKE84997.1 M20/M25/M40 family metallo-hydrolase [Vibrio sp. F12]TKE92421.1 M20/M25/M40 family metallo-hydrolase [Vibrio sp. F12]
MTQINEQRLVEHFCDLVKIDSESRNEKAIAEALAEQLGELGFEVHKLAVPEEVSNGFNIYARLDGTLPGSTVFSCHMDTVTPGIGIEPIIEDGIIRSKGNTILGGDDKSGIAAIMEAVRVIQAEGQAHKTIEIAFTVFEEGGLFGSLNFDMSYIQSEHAIVLDTGGPIGTIVNAAPGQQKIVAKIKGRPAHAGLAPEEGISAIQVAADAITKMNLLRIDEETTANIGIVEGGQATNIVMPELKVVAEARSLNGEKLTAQVEHMISTFEESAKQFGAEVEIESTRAYDAFVIADDHPHILSIKSAFEKLDVTANTKRTGGGSDANNFNAKGLTTVNLSTGMAKVHTTEEYIAVKDMVAITEFVVAYVTQ